MDKKILKKNDVIKILKSFKLRKLNCEKINLKNINNRILSKNIISSINVPPFKNSAVDGFAIRGTDINSNKRYKVSVKILAGDNRKVVLKKNQAARIFTGAKMPINADTVVMQENAVFNNDEVYFTKKPKIKENCRLAGEDINKNKLLFHKGKIIKINTQSILAAAGINYINVYKKLSIGYFTSGNELKNPTKKLTGSQINNSNRFSLSSLIQDTGMKNNNLGNLKDNFKNIENSILNAASKFDAIITTGGASVGEEDHIVKVLKKIGKIIFWKIAIKPGRPLALGVVNNKPVICLPGNPVSVFLLYSMLIKPFLLKLSGAKWQEPNYFPAKINFKLKKKTARMEWLRVNIEKNVNTELTLSKYPRQGSGILSSIAFSDGIIEIPERKSELKPGDVFKFYPFDSLY